MAQAVNHSDAEIASFLKFKGRNKLEVFHRYMSCKAKRKHAKWLDSIKFGFFVSLFNGNQPLWVI